jgi:hypothetical protein
MAESQKRDPKTKTDEKFQSERFKETARELGCDETGKAFEDAFTKIIPAKRPPRSIEKKAQS